MAAETNEKNEKQVVDLVKEEHEKEAHHKVPGTVVLTLIFLLCFALYYFANWKALSDVWHVR
jgi:hypothetical protein